MIRGTKSYINIKSIRILELRANKNVFPNLAHFPLTTKLSFWKIHMFLSLSLGRTHYKPHNLIMWQEISLLQASQWSSVTDWNGPRKWSKALDDVAFFLFVLSMPYEISRKISLFSSWNKQVLFHNDNKTRLNPNFGHQQQGFKGTHIPWQNEIHPE